MMQGRLHWGRMQVDCKAGDDRVAEVAGSAATEAALAEVVSFVELV